MTENSEKYTDVTLQAIPVKPRQVHQTFKVWLGDPDSTSDAEVLLAASRDPEFEACRLLLARGETGKLRTRWRGSKHYGMIMGLQWGADHCCQGGNRKALHIAKYAPLTYSWDDD